MTPSGSGNSSERLATPVAPRSTRSGLPSPAPSPVQTRTGIVARRSASSARPGATAFGVSRNDEGRPGQGVDELVASHGVGDAEPGGRLVGRAQAQPAVGDRSPGLHV